MTLELERRMTYKQDEIDELKEKVAKLYAENDKLIKENQMYDPKRLDQYKQQLQELEAVNKQLLTKLEEIQKNPPANELLEAKVSDYERLLSDIQKEINEKEQELDYYKTRVQHLEKKSTYLSMEQVERMNESSTTDLTALVYFDYSIVVQLEHKLVIRGDFNITNVSKQTLKRPTLCFRFSPPEFSNLRGKILTVDQVALNQQIPQQQASNWLFLDSEWAKEAEERGEIWLTSTDNTQIFEGETIAFNGFQITIETKFNDTLIVEGFVYFADSSLKVKSANNIIISY